MLSSLDRWLAPAPDPARVAWLREHVYAHRGMHGSGQVENSAGAFASALAAGLGIECDIQRSLDDWPMVFHDWDLDRLTVERGPVRRRTAHELAGIRLMGGDPVWALSMLLDEVATGDHAVRFELDNFNPWSTTTRVTGGERTRVNGSLEQR